jgi:hypothetical protein
MLMGSQPVSSWNRYTHVTVFLCVCSRRRRVLIPITCLTFSYLCVCSRRRRVVIPLTCLTLSYLCVCSRRRRVVIPLTCL